MMIDPIINEDIVFISNYSLRNFYFHLKNKEAIYNKNVSSRSIKISCNELEN